MRVCLSLVLFSCADPEDAGRSGVLLEWLQRDNAIWLSREPDLPQGKYRRMAADPYDFLRGTSGFFHEDLRRTSATRPESGLVQTAEAARILIIGDPHPENLGTFYRGADPGPGPGTSPPDLDLEWADHDAAGYGPWTSDVVRAAQGVQVYANGWPGCEEACRQAAADATLEGYAEAIRTLASGESLFRLEGSLWGNPFIQGLRAEAWEEGAERKRLNEMTRVTDGVRTFKLAETRGVDDEANLAPAGEERGIIDRVAAMYARDTGLRVLASARRYGQGVSSWPARRFLLVVDAGDPAADDDRLVNVREILDPPSTLAPPATIAAVWPDNGARVRAAAAATWPIPDLDPCFWTGRDGPATYKALCYDSWYQGPGHDKGAELWIDGDADQADFEAFGRGVGVALARAHARSRSADGAPALPVILEDLPDGSLAETLGPTAHAAAERSLADHQLLVQLLEQHGPWLGADTWSR